MFFQLSLICAKRCTHSAGEEGTGKRSGWERIEPAQLGKEHPDLTHGAERDNYGRKREVRDSESMLDWELLWG